MQGRRGPAGYEMPQKDQGGWFVACTEGRPSETELEEQDPYHLSSPIRLLQSEALYTSIAYILALVKIHLNWLADAMCKALIEVRFLHWSATISQLSLRVNGITSKWDFA